MATCQSATTATTTTATTATTTRIEDLYISHQSVLLTYLTRLVRDPELAEDVCQESFVKALRSWDTHAPTKNAVAWLYQIARNTAYDELRRRRRIHFSSLMEQHFPPRDEYALESSCGERELIQEALMQLPLVYRMTLLLHICGGYSVKEIARDLGCSYGTVKARLFRARLRFRHAYRG